MPRLLAQRAREITELRDEAKALVYQALSALRMEDILLDGALLAEETLPQLFGEAEALILRARAAGELLGENMMRQGGYDPGITDINFRNLWENAYEDAQREAETLARQVEEGLELAATRMSGQGMQPGAVIDTLRQDWERQNGGRIAGRLWTGLTAILSGLISRTYTLADNAIRHGQHIDAHR